MDKQQLNEPLNKQPKKTKSSGEEKAGFIVLGVGLIVVAAFFWYMWQIRHGRMNGAAVEHLLPKTEL